ncbi:MAG: hypothetical protein CSA65_09735 [Proteobacteria bacterium]|nr:MAG: hypothetical protein CSA65_09735 [Pseudomonadota bacterium]
MDQVPCRFGPFTLIERLNRSAMAEVYVASRPGDEPVVLKRLLPPLLQDPAFRRLFAHECYLGARLADPALPIVFEEGQIDGWPYMLLLPAAGLPLVRLLAVALKHHRRVSVPTALQIALPICRALVALHHVVDDEGSPLEAIHMDVSPHNVLVNAEGEVVLIDLGIARSRRLDAGSARLRGRSAYLAPEQLDAPGTIDARVDIFAFGTLLHETLCCRPLFRAATEEQTLYRLRHAPVPSLPEDLPHRERLDPILARCLARPPDERYPDTWQLRVALEDLAAAIQLDAHRAKIVSEINTLHVLAEATEADPVAPIRAKNARAGICAC